MASARLSSDIPTGVGETAIGIAAIRAEESRREDSLFDDPYAAAFVEETGADQLNADQLNRPDGNLTGFLGRTAGTAANRTEGDLAAFVGMVRSHVVVRTRFYDDYLRQAAEDGIRQIVVLAAGLDARAYRLPWPPGTRLFELDLPDMLAFKNRVLAARQATPRCERTTVAADLAGDWSARLLDAGLRPGEPTAWLVEGVLVYLTPQEAARLLTGIGTVSAPESRLSFEYGADLASLAGRAREAPTLARFAGMWKGGLEEPPPAWLRRHRWRVRTLGRAEVAAAYGRPIPENEDLGDGFLAAVRPEPQ